MPSNTFIFKQFTIHQGRCAMKVGTDAVLLGSWVKTYGVRRVLDIGTGTGVIALMLAQKSGAWIDAIDIDELAIQDAQENVVSSLWSDRVCVQQIAIQDYQVGADEHYDLIVSNPPYFSETMTAAEVARAAARHQLHLPFNDLLSAVARLLTRDGKFCVILPSREGVKFLALAASFGLHLTRFTRVKTTPYKVEKRWLMQFTWQPKTRFSESTLIIEKDSLNEQHYTDEYRELTKAYYLYF
jgi:tRNA1Val (adenine37-N6)-methyltransferase